MQGDRIAKCGTTGSALRLGQARGNSAKRRPPCRRQTGYRRVRLLLCSTCGRPWLAVQKPCECLGHSPNRTHHVLAYLRSILRSQLQAIRAELVGELCDVPGRSQAKFRILVTGRSQWHLDIQDSLDEDVVFGSVGAGKGLQRRQSLSVHRSARDRQSAFQVAECVRDRTIDQDDVCDQRSFRLAPHAFSHDPKSAVDRVTLASPHGGLRPGKECGRGCNARYARTRQHLDDGHLRAHGRREAPRRNQRAARDSLVGVVLPSPTTSGQTRADPRAEVQARQARPDIAFGFFTYLCRPSLVLCSSPSVAHHAPMALAIPTFALSPMRN